MRLLSDNGGLLQPYQRKTDFDLWLLFSQIIACGVASEDEQTRLWLRQRSLAQAFQNPGPLGLPQRWQAFESTHQLLRPQPGGHYDASIARPSENWQQTARSLGLRIHYAAEPDAISQVIEGHWPDVRREVSPHNQWKLHAMHDSAHSSAFFPRTYRRYLLTMDWERHCRPRQVAIAVEISWHHAHGWKAECPDLG